MTIPWKYLTTFERRKRLGRVVVLMGGLGVFLSICLLSMAVTWAGAAYTMFCLGAYGLRYCVNALTMALIFIRSP